MNILKLSWLYFSRKKKQSLLIIIILGLIFLGELIGLFLYQTALQGQKDAFLYNGSSLLISDNEQRLDETDYATLDGLDYVQGISNWKEVVITPAGTHNVKDHIGVDVSDSEEDERKVGDDMVLLACMDIPMYQLFRWEKNVSLTDGVFPDSQTDGVLIENRYARENNLSVGDTVTFAVNESGKQVSVTICGIYTVNSDFEILNTNTEGESVFIHSPYNTIYMDYYQAQKLFEFEDGASFGCELYVDTIEHLQDVADQIHSVYGDRLTVYDNTTQYLQNECQIVTLMNRLAVLICLLIFIMGQIILVVVLSFLASEYKKETALFLTLGDTKQHCVARYSIIIGLYILSGLILAILLYMISSQGIVSIVQHYSMQFIEKSQDMGYGGYRNTGIGLGFRLEMNRMSVFSKQAAGIMSGIAVGSWIIGTLLPIYTVVTSKTRNILNQ